MKVACGTESGETPVWQGATRENSVSIRLKSNAARRDASPVAGLSPRAPSPELERDATVGNDFRSLLCS